jgi:regulator of protease activity HflC (stomatin/prohibitin superfamily)
MGFFTKEYEVRPNQAGFLFRNHVFEQRLEPGRHKINDWKNRTELITLPTAKRLINVINQEVLTRDNIALRFSYVILYKIEDGLKFLNQFELDKAVHYLLAEGESRLNTIVQVHVRNKIASYDSEMLNELRVELTDLKNEEMERQAAELGISIDTAQVRDITFPKTIQDLFSRQLEAKIRAKADLENARTAVATARALKNASDLMKDDDNIRFFQLMETITKISQKGKHTFMIGDLQQMTKK